jgi:hypothetical protein
MISLMSVLFGSGYRGTLAGEMGQHWTARANTGTYPDSYSEGLLFAVSGMDGDIDYDGDLVGTTLRLEYGFGLSVHLPDRHILVAETGPCWKDVRPRVVLTDLLIAAVGNQWAAFLALGSATVAGVVPEWCGIHLYNAADWTGREGRIHATSEITSYQFQDRNYVLARRKVESHYRFGFAFSRRPEEAMRLAQRAAECKLDAAIEARLDYYDAHLPSAVPEPWCRAYLRSVSVLRSTINPPNRMSPYSWLTPDRLPHKRMWIWDTVFQVFAVLPRWPSIGLDAIRSVFSYQRPDGFIPHLMSPDSCSSLVQPPILGWSLAEVAACGGEPDGVAELLDGNARFLRWIRAHRTKADGLPGWHVNPEMPWCRCDESGMDNSPRFDHHEDVGCVDLASYLIHDIECMGRAGHAIGRSMDADLDAYRRSLLQMVSQRFWSSEKAMFLDVDTETGKHIPVPGVHSFLPLFAGAASQQQADVLETLLLDPARFWTPTPLPSVSRDHPAYSRDYWRGASWLNCIFMAVIGLRRYGKPDTANRLARAAVDQVAVWHDETGGIYECYDPEGGVSPEHLPLRTNDIGTRSSPSFYGPIKNYGWTAAAFLCLCDFLVSEDGSPTESP